MSTPLSIADICPEPDKYPKSYINLICIYKFETGTNTIVIILLSLAMFVALAILWKSRSTLKNITQESPAHLYDETYNTISVVTLKATRVLLIFCCLNYIMYMV